MAEKMGVQCNTYFHSFLSHHASAALTKYISRIPVIYLTIYPYYMKKSKSVQNAKVRHPPQGVPAELTCPTTVLTQELPPSKELTCLTTVLTQDTFCTQTFFQDFDN